MDECCLPRLSVKSATQVTLLMAPGDDAVHRGVVWLQSDRLLQKVERFVGAFRHCGGGERQRAKKQIVRIQVVGPFAPDPLDFYVWAIKNTRGTLAMAVYKALPSRFGTVHPRYKTPGFSTLIMGVIAVAFYVGMTLISENILADTILSLGLAIAFYYAITGYACVWYFRREAFASFRNFIYKFLFPLLGALLLTGAFVKSAIDMLDPDYGYTVIFGIGGVFVVGVGSLLLGVVLNGTTREAAPYQRYYYESYQKREPRPRPKGDT